MPQWSLRTLLIATAIVPVAIFAIAQSTRFYATAMVNLAAVAWTIVAIAACSSTVTRQKWARGAIVAATAYGLFLYLLPSELELEGSGFVTSGALFYAHRFRAHLIGEEEEENLGLRPTPSDAAFAIYRVGPATLFPERQNFAIIGHVYCGVLFGIAGGYFAQWLVQHEQRNASLRTSNGTVQ